MKIFDRDYICPSCFLLYTGYWNDDRGVGREPCPNCHEVDVHARDSMGASYWELAMYEEHGEGFLRSKYWWIESRVGEECRKELEAKGFTKLDKFKQYC